MHCHELDRSEATATQACVASAYCTGESSITRSILEHTPLIGARLWYLARVYPCARSVSQTLQQLPCVAADSQCAYWWVSRILTEAYSTAKATPRLCGCTYNLVSVTAAACQLGCLAVPATVGSVCNWLICGC